METAVVIQGPTTYYKEIIPVYKNCSGVVWCTWMDEPADAIIAIEQSNIHLHLIDKPKHSGVVNINYQSKSTYEGLIKAKELFNAQMYIKIRSDFDISDVNLLSRRFADIGLPLNFLGWAKIKGGFFLDYIVAGNFDEMTTFWAYEDANVGEPFPEKFLTSRYYQVYDENIDIENLIKTNNIEFPLLNDIDIYWIKRQVNIKKFMYDMVLNYHGYKFNRIILFIKEKLSPIKKKFLK